MDDRKILEDAKKTIDNIKRTQGALDEYLLRLEAIVRKLEAELYKDEKLTVSDVTSINKQLSPEMFDVDDDEEIVVEKPKKKRKFGVNVVLIFSVLSILVTMFIQFVRLNDVIHFGNTSYLIYDQVNMEPTIKLNSLVIIDNERMIKEQDVIAYYTKHKTIRIKQIDKVEDDKFIVKNVEQTIKAYEDIDKNDKIGVVKKYHHKLGDIIATLSHYILILYFISILSLVIGIIIN